MVKGNVYGVCMCCRDDWFGPLTLAECDSCRRMVCRDCLLYVESEGRGEYQCCECRGVEHEGEPTDTDLDELEADIRYHADKDEGKYR